MGGTLNPAESLLRLSIARNRTVALAVALLYCWKQWGRSGYRELKRRGITTDLAWNTFKSAHGPWHLSQSPALVYALPTSVFQRMGLPRLANG